MKIGIIGAMEIEVEQLKKEMQVTNTVTKASMEFNEGKIGNTDVVVVKSGVGKVNAGICVQILVDLFNVTHIINTGIAHKDYGVGQIGAGLVNPPEDCFKKALSACAEAWA